MIRDRWKVVRLYRYKREEVVSRHWWRWTADLACFFYCSAPKYPNNDVYDVWRI